MSRRSYSTTLMLLLLVMGFASDVHASVRFADKLINEHIRALGGYKKITAIQSLRLTGTYQEGYR